VCLVLGYTSSIKCVLCLLTVTPLCHPFKAIISANMHRFTDIALLHAMFVIDVCFQ